MSTATVPNTTAEYKVADMSLADWGRKEISIAEYEMPGLMAIRKKYAAAQAAEGRARHRVAAHDHPDRGSDRDPGRIWAPTCAGPAAISFPLRIMPPPPSPPPAFPYSRGRARSLEEYWWCTYQAVSHPGGKGPELVVDDGGDVTLLIHKGYELEHGDKWVELALFQPRREGDQGSAQAGPCRASAPLDRNGESTGAASPRRPPPACTGFTKCRSRANY